MYHIRGATCVFVIVLLQRRSGLGRDFITNTNIMEDRNIDLYERNGKEFFNI